MSVSRLRAEPYFCAAIERVVAIRKELDFDNYRAHARSVGRPVTTTLTPLLPPQEQAGAQILRCHSVPPSGEAPHDPWTLHRADGRTLSPGRYRFVVPVDAPETLLLLRDRRGMLQGHTTLSRYAPVLFAGCLNIGQRGNLTRWDDASGHYRPSPGLAAQAPLPPSLFHSEGLAEAAQRVPSVFTSLIRPAAVREASRRIDASTQHGKQVLRKVAADLFHEASEAYPGTRLHRRDFKDAALEALRSRKRPR